MAENTADGHRTLGQRVLPNWLLAAASAALAVMAIIAVVKGRADWAQVPWLVWVHLASIIVATVLTPVMLMRRKGDGRHRALGYVWVCGMMVAAVTSLFFNTRDPDGWGVFSGDFSPIHILSVLVLVMVPVIVKRARAHDRVRHEEAVRGMVFGALLIAGFFTFPFGRMLGVWLFS